MIYLCSRPMAFSPGRTVRFAPSPTGRFHIGNLRTALISRDWARLLGAAWVVRFEDIDAPRVLRGAQAQQLEDMHRLGLVPDRVQQQTHAKRRHWKLFERAVREGRVYPCDCSRKEVRDALEASASAPHGELTPYSGRCRKRDHEPRAEMASLGWRFALDEDPSGRSDFVVARSHGRLNADGLPASGAFVPAYHWACAIDDIDGRHALLVRASDLANVVSQHRSIMAWVAGSDPFPAVFHTALITQDSGARLEKRTRGVTLEELVQAGWSAEKILNTLHDSFNLDASEWIPGRIFGELEASRTLSSLGLKII